MVRLDLIELVGRRWWAVALRGVVAIAFGIMAWAWSDITLGTLITLFGIFTIADGITSIVAAFQRERSSYGFLPLLLTGVVDVLLGVIVVVWPDLSALALMYVIGFWALFTGIMELVTAFQLRRLLPDLASLVWSGAISLIFGILVVIAPGSGAIALVRVIGLFAIVFGVSLVILAFRLRAWAEGR